MTIYYVAVNGNDSNNGLSAANAFKTLTKADTVCSAGDTIRVQPGTYGRAHITPSGGAYRLLITKANTTWVADGNVTIDGGYGPDLFRNGAGPGPIGNRGSMPGTESPQWAASMPGKGEYNSMIAIRANGVTLDGFIIRNISGRFISVEADNCVVKNCKGDFCYSGAIVMEGPNTNARVKNNLVVDCWFSRWSMRWYDGDRSNQVVEGVEGGVKTKNAEDCVYRRVWASFGRAEGFACAKGSLRTIFEDCRLWNSYHNMMYDTKLAKDSVYRRNVSVHTYHLDAVLQMKAPTNLAYGRETRNTAGAQQGYSFIAYCNLIIGGFHQWEIDNGAHYDTTMEHSYVGYNTFITTESVRSERPNKANYGRGFMLRDNTKGNDHTADNIIENNIILGGRWHDGATIFEGGSQTKAGWFRNNIWSVRPNDTRARGTDSIFGTGDPEVFARTILKNPHKALPPGVWGPCWEDTAMIAFMNNLEDYRPIATSPAIGAARARTALNNTNVPDEVKYDVQKSLRTNAPGGFFDIGALEYGGQITQPPGDIDASFTQSTSSGEVPLSVTFTDTSTADNLIAVRLWEFGDGQTSTAQNPVHVYSNPGSYTVTLTVTDNEGTSDSASSTVTALPSTGGGGGEATAGYDIVQKAAISDESGGEIAFTFDFGFDAVPQAVLFLMSGATVAGTPANNALFSIGMCNAAGQQWSHTIDAVHNYPGSRTGSNNSTNHVLKSIDSNLDTRGQQTGAASFARMGINTCVLSVPDAFPADYLITAMAIAGDPAVTLGESYFGVKDDTGSIDVPFTPDVLIAAGSFGATGAGKSADGLLTIGGIGGWQQMMMSSWMDGLAPAQNLLAHDNGIARNPRSTNSKSTIVSGTSSGGLSTKNFKVANQAFTDVISWAAVNMGGALQASVQPIVSPTVVSTPGITFPFKIGAGILVMTPTNLTFTNSYTDDVNAGFAVGVFDAGGCKAHAVSHKDNVGTTVAKSYVDTAVKVRNGDGTVVLAVTPGIDGSGNLNLDWTVVQPDARYGFVIVFEAGVEIEEEVTGPLAFFTANPTTVKRGESIQFSSAGTNPNGSAITSYLWEFNDEDGSTSAEENPVFAYLNSGVYDVSLTVTNANGTHTYTRSAYITVAAPARYRIGPFQPQTMGRTTVTELNHDEATIAIGADFDAIQFDEETDTAALDAVAGKIVIGSDAGSKTRLAVLFPNGTVKYITLGDS